MRAKPKSSLIILLTAGFLIFAFLLLLTVVDIKVTPSESFLTLLGKLNLSRDVSEKPTYDELALEVIPEEGYKVNLVWGDIGQKLVETGAIDLTKFKENYPQDEYGELLTYLTSSKAEGIRIDRESSYFWVNTLWALGLTQKSDVLTNGVMGEEYGDRLGSFASTGGWTLGAKDAVTLFSSEEIIPLTAEEQKLVARISQGIYRPCCGNPTSFPDCNHGMAILGLIELMVSQGFSEEEIYQAALAFNSYWFGQTYLDLAYYFKTKEGVSWDEINPVRVLSAEFSSAPGYAAIKKQIEPPPETQEKGGNCGA